MKSGKLEPVRTKDLLAAAGKVKPSTREWFATRGTTPSTPTRAARTTTS